MKTSETAGRLTPYVRRLLDDDYVHDELRKLVVDVRRSASRAKRIGPERAVTDKRVRRHAAAGVSAAAQVIRALNEPEPTKRHRVRRLVTLTLIGVVAFTAYRNLVESESDGSAGDRAAGQGSAGVPEHARGDD